MKKKNPVIAMVQYSLQSLPSQQSFWDRLQGYVEAAHHQGADLILFPEYLTGNLLSLGAANTMSHAQARAYIASFTDRYMQTFRRLSREYKITIQGGTHLTQENGNYYNTAYLFHPDGYIDTQRKIHLTPEERRQWGLTPGEGVSIFDTEIGKVAILICYDIEFPELSRIVADRGVQLILCPSYTDAAAGYYRVRNCSQARAIENQLFVVLSGLVGQQPHVPQVDVGYCQAGIFAPCDYPFPADGILTTGDLNQEQIVYGEISWERLADNHKHGNVSPFFDRRLTVYKEPLVVAKP
jgi:predicted amidohydrolase